MLINTMRIFTAACRVAAEKRGVFAPQQHYGFTVKWDRNTVLQKLAQDTNEMTENIMEDESMALDRYNYFIKKGWTVAYEQSKKCFTYSRTKAAHDVKVLVPVPYPPLQQKDENTRYKSKKTKASNQSSTRKLNYSYIVVGIKKTTGKKWLCSELSVFQQKSVKMLSAFFSRLPPALIKIPTDQYYGPIFSNLSEQIQKILSGLLMDVGLSSRMLINMVIHSTGKVDEINQEWLIDAIKLWDVEDIYDSEDSDER